MPKLAIPQGTLKTFPTGVTNVWCLLHAHKQSGWIGFCEPSSESANIELIHSNNSISIHTITLQGFDFLF